MIVRLIQGTLSRRALSVAVGVSLLCFALAAGSATAEAALGGSGSAARGLGGRPQAQAGESSGEVIDRIVAVVNGEVITLGQLRRALRLYEAEAFSGLAGPCGSLAPREPGDVPAGADVEGGGAVPSQPTTGTATAAASLDPQRLESETLACLIDHLLIFQYVRRFPQVGITSDDVDAAYQRIVASFPSRRDFEAEMERWGYTVKTLRQALERQLLVNQYIDTRFSTYVDVSDDEVRDYYENVLIPEMQRRGTETPDLENVADRITAIVRLEKVNQRVDSWINELRQRARIETYLW